MKISPALCREINETDLDAIADLLLRGFAGRSRDYWVQGLQRQSARSVPQGYPRYGYMLEHQGKPVGVLLLLFTEATLGDRPGIRCNVASWYVDPPFRGHAPRLVWSALRHKDVTYMNVTPATSTWSIVEALGFKRYCNGLMFALPMLSPRHPGARIEIVSADSAAIDSISASEMQQLARHAGYGCLSLVVHKPNAGAHPFILVPYRVRHGSIALPAMQLIYCRDVADFVGCANAIGTLLLKRGKPIVVLDANGKVDGLAGYYTEARGRKYFRGPALPSLADLRETELVLFGL